MGFDSSLVQIEFTVGGFSIEVHTVLYGEPTHHHQYRRRDSGSMQRISPRDDRSPATDFRRPMGQLRSRKPTNGAPIPAAFLRQLVLSLQTPMDASVSSFERVTADRSCRGSRFDARATQRRLISTFTRETARRSLPSSPFTRETASPSLPSSPFTRETARRSLPSSPFTRETLSSIRPHPRRGPLHRNRRRCVRRRALTSAAQKRTQPRPSQRTITLWNTTPIAWLIAVCRTRPQTKARPRRSGAHCPRATAPRKTQQSSPGHLLPARARYRLTPSLGMGNVACGAERSRSRLARTRRQTKGGIQHSLDDRNVNKRGSHCYEQPNPGPRKATSNDHQKRTRFIGKIVSFCLSFRRAAPNPWVSAAW
jgi:hypothetical protein